MLNLAFHCIHDLSETYKYKLSETQARLLMIVSFSSGRSQGTLNAGQKDD